MTPEEFSAIKARVAIATPGPWYWRSGNHTANLKTADSGGIHTKAIRTKVLPDGRPFIDDNVLFATGVVDGDPYWKARLIEANKKRPVLSLALELVGSKADIDFVANSREDIPNLIAEIQRLQARLNDLEGPEGRTK